jgi:CheY-like chemotaxis protein
MPKKILVVDDEPDMVTYLCALFEDNGYVTVTASDGEEALEKVKSEKPDLISLDLLMPNKTGIKMFRELRKADETKDVPVVMVTGFGKDDVPSMDFKEWVTKRAIRPPEAYIEKPVVPEVLIEAVKRIIG